MSVDIALLAAGQSSRMRGRDKLLEVIDGVPLLRRAVSSAMEVEGARVLVALPHERTRDDALEGLTVAVVRVRDAAEGMGRSIAAVAAAGDGPLILSFADMPEIDASAYRTLIAAGTDRIVRAVSEDGSHGHPILFPARLRARLTDLTGDEGPRDLVKSEGALPVTIPGATVDLDTPEDWAAWRARRLRAAR